MYCSVQLHGGLIKTSPTSNFLIDLKSWMICCSLLLLKYTERVKFTRVVKVTFKNEEQLCIVLACYKYLHCALPCSDGVIWSDKL